MRAYWGTDGHKVHCVHKVTLGWLSAGRRAVLWVTLCGLWSRNTLDMYPTKTHVNCKKCEKVYNGS